MSAEPIDNPQVLPEAPVAAPPSDVLPKDSTEQATQEAPAEHPAVSHPGAAAAPEHAEAAPAAASESAANGAPAEQQEGSPAGDAAAASAGGAGAAGGQETGGANPTNEELVHAIARQMVNVTVEVEQDSAEILEILTVLDSDTTGPCLFAVKETLALSIHHMDLAVIDLPSLFQWISRNLVDMVSAGTAMPADLEECHNSLFAVLSAEQAKVKAMAAVCSAFQLNTISRHQKDLIFLHYIHKSLQHSGKDSAAPAPGAGAGGAEDALALQQQEQQHYAAAASGRGAHREQPQEQVMSTRQRSGRRVAQRNYASMDQGVLPGQLEGRPGSAGASPYSYAAVQRWKVEREPP